MNVKSYNIGEGKLLSDKKQLKLNKLKPYMIKTGILTGIYLVPTNLKKYKPKSITKEKREKMTKAEKDLDKRKRKEYRELLETSKSNSYLQIKHSWIELCIYMLGTIHSNNKSNFLRFLLDNEVMNNGFTVTTKLVDYADRDGHKKIYKIPLSNFYLETNMDESSLYKSIKAMAKALELEEDRELLFDITAKNEHGIKLKEGVASDIHTEMSLVEALSKQNSQLNISGITISGEQTYVASNTECLAVFLASMYKMYRKQLLDASRKYEVAGVAGISEEKTDANVTYKPIKGTKHQCYSNGDSYELIKYMHNILTEVGYLPMLVNITIREIGFTQTN